MDCDMTRDLSMVTESLLPCADGGSKRFHHRERNDLLDDAQEPSES